MHGAYEVIATDPFELARQAVRVDLAKLDEKIQTETAPILGSEEGNADRIKSHADAVILKRDGLSILTDQFGGGRATSSREMALQLEKGFGSEFQSRIEHLKERAAKDPEFAVKLDDTIKREMETVAKGILESQSVGKKDGVEYTLQSVKILDAANGKKKAFIVSTGRGRIFKLDTQGILSPVLDAVLEQHVRNENLSQSEAEQILDVQAGSVVDADLNQEKVRYEKRKQIEIHTNDVRAVSVDVKDGDRILVLSEGAARQLTADALRRMLGNGETPAQLEKEIQLNASVHARSETDLSSKDIAVSVLEVGAKPVDRTPAADYSPQISLIEGQMKKLESNEHSVVPSRNLQKLKLQQELESLKYANAKAKFDSSQNPVTKAEFQRQMEQAQTAYHDLTPKITAAREDMVIQSDEDRKVKEDAARRKLSGSAGPKAGAYSSFQL